MTAVLSANRALNELELLLGDPGRPHLRTIRNDQREKTSRITRLTNKIRIMEKALVDVQADASQSKSIAQCALEMAGRILP